MKAQFKPGAVRGRLPRTVRVRALMVTLDGGSLTIEQVVAVARDGAKVSLHPEAAARVEDRLVETFELLAIFPRMGHARPDLRRERCSFLRVGPVYIAYLAEPRPIKIVGVDRTERDWARRHLLMEGPLSRYRAPAPRPGPHDDDRRPGALV